MHNHSDFFVGFVVAPAGVVYRRHPTLRWTTVRLARASFFDTGYEPYRRTVSRDTILEAYRSSTVSRIPASAHHREA